MPPQRVVPGLPARRNVDPQDQRVPNAPEFQPLGETLQGQVSLRICKNFVEELQKVLEVMHVAHTECMELALYQLKDMVADIRSRTSLFVSGLSRLSRKEGKNAMLIGDIDIARLMIHVQQVEKEKMRDKEELRNKKAKTTCNESGQQNVCRDGSTGFFKCGQTCNFMSECHKNRQGTTIGVTLPQQLWQTELHLEELLQGQAEEQTDCASLSIVTPYITMRLDILPERLLERFIVSTLVDESILVESVYHYCVISINHKDTMADLVELDIVHFDVILGMDWLHACYASVDCRTRVVKFQFPNDPVIEWRSSSAVPKGQFISYLKVIKLVSKGASIT
uniref:Gag-pol polyprotein n=1 Tax=Solanum tuberosum TaxID=4113 RepID=M1E0X7_SOLTU